MTPTAQARELRAVAYAFDAQRGKLPSLTDPHRLPEPTAICAQITELTTVIDQLSRHIVTHVSDGPTTPETKRTTSAYAAALKYAGQAIAALGEVSHQLAFLDQTWPLRENPDARDAREAAHAVIQDALTEADTALHDAASGLHATATWTLPPSQHRLDAARSRSTTTGPKHSPTTPPPAPASPSSSTTVRSR